MNLTFKGKIELIQSMGISHVFYTMQVKNLGDNEIMKINASLWDFLWDGEKRGLVKRDVCILLKKLGGLGMHDIQVNMQANRIVFVKNVILGPAEKLIFFPRKYFFIFDRYYNMQYFVLNVTDSRSHLHDKHIPSFYLKCIEYFQKFISVPDP